VSCDGTSKRSEQVGKGRAEVVARALYEREAGSRGDGTRANELEAWNQSDRQAMITRKTFWLFSFQE